MRKQQAAKSESEFAGGFEERTSSFSFTAFSSVESIWKYIHARSSAFVCQFCSILWGDFAYTTHQMTVLKRHPLSRVCSEPLQRPDSLSPLGGCHSKFTLGSSQEWDVADGRAGSGAPACPCWQTQLGPVTCGRLGKAGSAGVPRAALGGLCAQSVRPRQGARDKAEPGERSEWNHEGLRALRVPAPPPPCAGDRAA